jgi:predicted HTH domain antitoxin
VSADAEEERERERRRRQRSIAIALALGGLVILFYIATLVRLGGNVFNRPL